MTNDTPASPVPSSLLGAWVVSAVWAVGCVGVCLLVRGWANEYHALEVGTQGYEQLALLVLAVLVGAVLFHTQAYKAFQRAYLAQADGRDLERQLAVAWLVVVCLLRVGWMLTGLLLLVCLLFKGEADAGWR